MKFLLAIIATFKPQSFGHNKLGSFDLWPALGVIINAEDWALHFRLFNFHAWVVYPKKKKGIRNQIAYIIIPLLLTVGCSKTVPFAGTDKYPIIIKTCKEWEHKSRIGKYPFAGDSVCTNWKLDTIYGKFKQP